MATAGGYSISIGLTDGVTKPLEAINRKLQEIQAPVKRFQSSFAKFADLSGLSGVVNGMKNLGGHVLSALGYVLRLIPAMGALTGAASVAGIFKLVTSWGEFGTRLLSTSAILGTSVTRLQELEGAAKLAGASAEDMDAAIAGLGASMQAALSGNNSQAIQLFQQEAGMDITAKAFQAKNGAEKMAEAFNILKKGYEAGNSADVIKQKAAILGIPEALIRLAESGKLQKYIDQFNKLANPLSAKQVVEADAFRESMTNVTTAIGGVVNSITTALGPALTPLLNQLAAWIASNQKLVNETVTRWVRDFSTWIKAINWTEVIQGVKDFASGADDLVKSLGGAKAVAIDFLELWLGAKALSVAATLAQMAVNMRVLAGGGLPAVAGAARGAAGVAGAAEIALPAAGALAGIMAAVPWVALGAVVAEFLPPLLHHGLARVFGNPDGPRPASEGGSGHTIDSEATHRNNTDRQTGHAATGKELEARESAEYARAISLGATPTEAAALAANAARESGVNAGSRGDKVNGEYTAFGKYQWHQPRVDAIRNHYGIDVKTAGEDDQTRAAIQEYRDEEKKAGDAVRAAKTARDAGAILSRQGQRPGLTEDVKAREAATRGDMAQGIYDREQSRNIHGLTATKNPELNGQVGVTITHANAPAGSSVSATSSGIVSTPRIVTPMPAG